MGTALGVLDGVDDALAGAGVALGDATSSVDAVTVSGAGSLSLVAAAPSSSSAAPNVPASAVLNRGLVSAMDLARQNGG